MSMNKYINNTFITIPPTKKKMGLKIGINIHTYYINIHTSVCVCVYIFNLATISWLSCTSKGQGISLFALGGL